MLHKETVNPLVFDLIYSLEKKSYLEGFLGGGTGLALHIGHR
jgi:hypothetical protein